MSEGIIVRINAAGDGLGPVWYNNCCPDLVETNVE